MIRLALYNWKPALLGALQVIIVLATQAMYHFDGNPETVVDYNVIAVSVSAFLALLNVRQSGNSSAVEKSIVRKADHNTRGLFLIPLLLCTSFCIATPALAQSGTDPIASSEFQDIQVVEAASGDSFHREIIRTALSEVRKGNLSRRDMIRLRVAMLSPSFREHAKELAIIQMASSGSENLPFTESGTVDEAAINWEGLTAFMEKFIPLLLKLIESIAGMGLADYFTPSDYVMLASMLYEYQPDIQLAA